MFLVRVCHVVRVVSLCLVSLSCLYVLLLVFPLPVLCFHVCPPQPVMSLSLSLDALSLCIVFLNCFRVLLCPLLLSPKSGSCVKLCELVRFSVFDSIVSCVQHV